MEFLLISFFAGLLTILSPCVLPLLPVIIGGTLTDKKPSKWTPLVITASLATSVILFTLILRASTALIDIPDSFWKTISGGILVIFGLITIFPVLWESVSAKLNLNASSNKLLGKSVQMEGQGKNIAIGAALGPVFISCSPTFAVILAVILPVSFSQGFIYLIAYTLGLATILLALSYAGQKFASKLAWATDPKGIFKRILGVLFVIVGIMIITSYDKVIESYLLDQGFYDGISEFEQGLYNK